MMLYNGDFIRKRYEDMGLRAADLASRANVSIGSVYKAFKGENVEVQTLVAILKVLGVNLDLKEAA